MTDDIQTAAILVNPSARGVARRFNATRALGYLRSRGVEAELVVPGSGSEMTRRAREAAERGVDLLFVVGGDGSLRDAAGGLAGSGTALAAIPAGTANVWARETGIPPGLRAAFDAHLHGQRARIDLGRAGEQPFLMLAGVGWDAAIARRVPAALKRWLGPAAYILEAGLTLPSMRTQTTRWSAGAEEHEEPLAVMVISNTRLYGGLVEFNPRALVDDGLLDVCALLPRRTGDGVQLAARLVLGRLRGNRRLYRDRVGALTVETPGLPVQLDGDPIAETPVRFSVEPGALLVSVPRGPLPPMFSQASSR